MPQTNDPLVPACSIAVMCYNESGNLRPMIERTVKTLRGMNVTYEILIVDDGSKDGSAELADTLAAEYPNEVRVLHHPTNTGIGSVLIDGYRKTRGEIVA